MLLFMLVFFLNSEVVRYSGAVNLMYCVYGNSSWYIHSGPLHRGSVCYWEGPLSEVPLNIVETHMYLFFSSIFVYVFM